MRVSGGGGDGDGDTGGGGWVWGGGRRALVGRQADEDVWQNSLRESG